MDYDNGFKLIRTYQKLTYYFELELAFFFLFLHQNGELYEKCSRFMNIRIHNPASLAQKRPVFVSVSDTFFRNFSKKRHTPQDMPFRKKPASVIHSVSIRIRVPLTLSAPYQYPVYISIEARC